MFRPCDNKPDFTHSPKVTKEVSGHGLENLEPTFSPVDTTNFTSYDTCLLTVLSQVTNPKSVDSTKEVQQPR
jgi:hypothetical protein